MRPRSTLRNWVEYGCAALAVATLEWTPLPLANVLGRGYGRLLDLAIPRLRRIALQNLEMALPELSVDEHVQIAGGVFHSIGRLLVAFARLPRIGRGNVKQWIRYQGLENFERARARGKGVLVATAHLGNWELSAYAHALMSAPMHVVVRPLDNPLIDGMVERRRTLSGNGLTEKKDFARAILSALARNEAVGILVDQNTSLESGHFVNFFGIPACSGTTFAKIAFRTGAAVVPGYALWNEKERRYVLRFDPEVPVTGDLAVDTAAIQKRLEAVIREFPGQWLWIHRRWKTRPPGQPPLYR